METNLGCQNFTMHTEMISVLKRQKKRREKEWRFIHEERTGSKSMAGKPYLHNHIFQIFV